MDRLKRKKIIAPIKVNHKYYLKEISNLDRSDHCLHKFKVLTRRFQDLLRKEHGSSNSSDLISTIANHLFGLREDISKLSLPYYDFADEILVLNQYIVPLLEKRRASKYFGECASYGETLLNCYIDLFVTFTVPKTVREIGAKPGYLLNPLTGSHLEIDVLLEDFRLGFEFQGEHHYTDSTVQVKDSHKLSILASHKRILIPINISQLSFQTLAKLIVNSMKDYLKLHDLLVYKDERLISEHLMTSRKLMGRFSKAAQRIYLATVFFEPTLNWLDSKTQQYITNMSTRNPTSSTQVAPRQTMPKQDLEVEYIYRNLKYVTTARKNLNSIEKARR